MMPGRKLRSCLAAMICLAPGLGQAEEGMGRLFFTPGERASLDLVRQNSKTPERAIKPEEFEIVEPEAAPLPAIPSTVTVQGYVKRSDGKGTVWVNRQPVQEKSSLGEIGVGALGAKDNRVRLKVPGSGKTVELKAGQTYDPASGQIVDNPRELPELPPAAPSSPDDQSGKPAPADAAKKP